MGDSAGHPNWLYLDDEERVSMHDSPSRKLLLAAFALAFVLLIVLSLLVGAVGDVGTGRRLSWVIVALTVGVILHAFYTIRRREYIVTDRRAAVGVGLWSKRTRELALGDVEDVTVDQSLLEGWFGIGTVRLEAGAGQSLAFPFVERPHVVAERALTLLDTGSSTVAG